ncbi:MAG: hypothetical protein LBC20_07020 [Planctomycetaceae bacterium]|jgi:hypothetical protein|nr:hypothetical protein [Planctomycetaceae bacterium]
MLVVCAAAIRQVYELTDAMVNDSIVDYGLCFVQPEFPLALTTYIIIQSIV